MGSKGCVRADPPIRHLDSPKLLAHDHGDRLDVYGCWDIGLVCHNLEHNYSQIQVTFSPHDSLVASSTSAFTNLLTTANSLFEAAAAWVPLAVGGALAAIASGHAIRLLPAQYIMAIGSLAACVSLIIVSTQPAHQIYWAQSFPAITITALGPDFIFTAAQIIASNAVKRKHQGIAGSLIGTLASYGLSTGLGFSGTVETYTNENGKDPVAGFRHALYLGIGIAATAVFLALFFVRIPKDERDGWDDDDQPEVQVQSATEKKTKHPV